jgi:hypothetical protein
MAGSLPDADDPRLAALAQSLATLVAEVSAIRATVSEMSVVQAEMRTRLRRTQALTARAYEAALDWPGLLAAARASADYDAAYEDPDPLISIPIPTYHSPDTLCDRALASVLAQTHGNWEAIVVGDHCTDDTRRRVEAIGDPRIAFHNLDAREHDPADPWETYAVKGSVPRATGIGLARGRWIAPLSHDDAWDADHLATLLAAARRGRAEVVYSRLRRVLAAATHESIGSIGAYPPRHGDFGWQSAMFHGSLRFLVYDRACALASEPNDWNLARRAWQAGVRFSHVERETVTLYIHDRATELMEAYAALGLPIEAAAAP